MIVRHSKLQQTTASYTCPKKHVSRRKSQKQIDGVSRITKERRQIRVRYQKALGNRASAEMMDGRRAQSSSWSWREGSHRSGTKNDLVGGPGALGHMILVPVPVLVTKLSRLSHTHSQSNCRVSESLCSTRPDAVFNRFRLVAALSSHTSASRPSLHFLLHLHSSRAIVLTWAICAYPLLSISLLTHTAAMDVPTRTINLLARQQTQSGVDTLVSLIANPFAQSASL